MFRTQRQAVNLVQATTIRRGGITEASTARCRRRGPCGKAEAAMVGSILMHHSYHADTPLVAPSSAAVCSADWLNQTAVSLTPCLDDTGIS